MTNNRWFILGILFFARFCMAAHYVLIAAVLPLLVADLQLSYAQVGLLIGLFMFPGVVLALPGGYLGMWLGDKRLTVLGLALITVGGAAFGFSTGFWSASVTRVVAGIGSSVLNVILYKMTSDWFSGREMATAVALVATSWPLGIGVALVVLGVIGVAWGWQTAALSVAVLSLLGMIAVMVWYRDPPHLQPTERPRPSLRSGMTGREVVVANAAGLVRMLNAVGQGTFISFAPNFLVTQGESVAHAGFVVSLMSYLMMGSTPLGGFIADRLRRPLTVIVGGTLVTGLMMVAVPNVSWVFLVFLLMGISAGFPAGPTNALPGAVLRPEVRSVGFGIFFTWTYAGHSVLPPLAGWLVDRTGTEAASLYFCAALVLLVVPALGLFRAVGGRVTAR